MDAIANHRLNLEWKNWCKDHASGIKAKPLTNTDGSLNLRLWQCTIPGQMETPWEGGQYKMIMSFPEYFPVTPPECRFDPPLFHPNVLPSGVVCLAELCEEKKWSPAFNIENILLRIQKALAEPDLIEAVQAEAREMYLSNLEAYEERIRDQAKSMAAGDDNRTL